MQMEVFEVWSVYTDGHGVVIGRMLQDARVELFADTPEQFAKHGIRLFCLSNDVNWYDKNDEELQAKTIVEHEGCIVSFMFGHYELAPLERGAYIEFIRVG